MFTIKKRFDFSASHQLTGLRGGHQCARMHGHNYSVEIVLRSETLNEQGFVMDYGDFDFFKRILDQRFEHRHLNDVVRPLQPSAENLARYFFDTVARHLDAVGAGSRLLYAVRVKETDKTEAEYCPA